MTYFDALILGILQGVTEFFPVSSSGHLILAQTLLGVKELDKLILFDLVIHLGTLTAIICIYRKKIIEYLKNKRTTVGICIAVLPLFPLLCLMKPIKELFNSPHVLGFFFLSTAAILYAGIVLGRSLKTRHYWQDCFIIGLFQTLAILPGLSRSGSTVSGARLMGWSYQDALSFSFLLAIPTIIGGTVLEAFQLWSGKAPALPDITTLHYAIGFFTSFLIGTAALKTLIKLGSSDKWMIFVWYCLILGICTILYFNI